ncbi:MAG: hypothetical protein AB1689_18520 [Thermodesulfobacteriota bacterium]
MERFRLAARWIVALVAACAAAAAPRAAAAQPDPDPELDVSVNYVYAAQLGFGGYRVGGLSVNVFSLPIEHTLRDVFLDWRLRISFPVLFGDYDFKGTVEYQGVPVRVRASQYTLGAEPKLKLEIPVLEPWTVSLIGAWGFGSTFDTRVHVRAGDAPRMRVREAEVDFWYYTYQAGISSLLQSHVDRWTFSLGNAFIYAGTADFATEENDVEAYGALETGVEARHPLGFAIDGYEPDGSLFFIWYYFTPSLEFTRVERASLQVDNIYEVGVTVGADPATPFQLPIVGNPRIGVSYRVGNDLDAVRVNFGFPF